MAPFGNDIVQSLPLADRRRLTALGESIGLESGQVLGLAGRTTRYVYFPTDSLISLLVDIDDRLGLELGMVGHEGMLGGHVMLAAQDPIDARVQSSGLALRISARAFRLEVVRSFALRRRLEHYLYVLLAQRARVAGCMHYHAIEPRLARWLLMNQDRVRSDHFSVTQEVMACVLGVRRVSVTEAAGHLQSNGLIHYHRGEITILDRSGLETASCSCYASDLAVYAQQMG